VSELLSLLADSSFWVAVLRIATPLIFGTLGVLLCERAGVLNLGIEGIMVAGAFIGWLTVHGGGSLWTGVFAAAVAGGLLGALHALLVVRLPLSQHVAGLGITLFATSLSYFAYRVLFPKVDSPPKIEAFSEMSWLPIPVLAEQTPLTLLAILLVPAIGYVLYRTPLGLAVRAVGESPHAVEAQGIDVVRLRSGAVIAGSALMGVAGSFLTLAAFNSRLDLRRAHRVRELASGQGTYRRIALRLLRCGATTLTASGRRHPAVSALFDAALRALDCCTRARCAKGRVPAGTHEALCEGHALALHSISLHDYAT
jgi:general nucleoside transport system permease protein